MGSCGFFFGSFSIGGSDNTASVKLSSVSSASTGYLSTSSDLNRDFTSPRADIKVDENVLIVNYKDESEAYKAFSELTQDAVNDYYFISQAAIVKKENGQYVIKDSDERLEKSMDDTLKGGLIGELIGLLGGPLGVILGGSIGSTIGSLKDAGEGLRDLNLVEYVYEAIPEGATVIVLQADEKGSDALTKKLDEYDVTISRVSLPELQKGIELLEKEKEKESD